MRSRRSILRSAVLAAGLLLAAPLPAAQAQVAVVDLRAILQAEQQVSQGLTQIQRLESQLSNQAAMLQHLQTDVTGPVAQITGQATSILQQAQGIGYGAQNVAQQYASLYPTTMPGASLASTQASLATWRQNNALALQQALQMQNQIAQGQTTTSAQVASAVGASQGAAGQTAAIQASNQLLAVVSAQLTQLQNLLITQARAEQTLAAQAQATQAAADADRQRAWAISQPPTRLTNPGQL
jgi:P-type conjugative transfer protein TrbJ